MPLFPGGEPVKVQIELMRKADSALYTHVLALKLFVVTIEVPANLLNCLTKRFPA